MASKNAYNRCAVCGTEFIAPNPDVLKCSACRTVPVKTCRLRVGKGSTIAAVRVVPGQDYDGHIELDISSGPMSSDMAKAIGSLVGPDLAPVAINHLERLSLLRALMEAAK